MNEEQIIEMIILGHDHVAPVLRKCGDVIADKRREEYYSNGFFQDEDCYELTTKGEEFLVPYIEEYVSRVKRILWNLEINKTYNIDLLIRELNLEKYEYGEDLVLYILKGFKANNYLSIVANGKSFKIRSYM